MQGQKNISYCCYCCCRCCSHHDSVWQSRGTAPQILKIGTTWRWMVSFTPWLLYSKGL